MTTARLRHGFELAIGALVVALLTPIVAILAAPPRVVRCVYRDGRDLWRMLAP